MKKILSIILSVVLMLGAASAAYAADVVNAAYTDIKTTNWAYDAVNTMSGKGIVKGYPDGSFKPSNTVTYGEFIKMALISDTGEDVGNAPAVNEATGAKQNWAKNYYDKALELKYFGSTDIKAEQLSSPIPRGGMALIISNILGETKLEDYAGLEASLKDVNSSVRNDYDIVKVYASGIITGYEDGSFKPENTLTRAESATVIYRLVDESKRVLPNEKKEEPKTETPTSGTDLGSVIKNYRTFEQAKIDAGGESLLAGATSYEFVTDMSGYKITDVESGRFKWIEINGVPTSKLGWGNMYLMKNNEIIEFSGDGKYTGDITTIEYFVFPRYQNIDHVIGIMPNPLYKEK